MQGRNSNDTNEEAGYSGSGYGTVLLHNGNPENSSQNIRRNHSPHTLSTTQPLNYSGTRNGLHGVLSGLTPLMHNSRVAKAHGKSLQSWMRRPNIKEENSVSHSPESFVINFESLNDNSNPISDQQQSYNNFTNERALEQYHPSPGVAHLGSNNNNNSSNTNNNQTAPHHFQESNRISYANNNNSSNNNTDNSTVEIPIVQAAEGSQNVSNSGPSHEVRSLDKFLHKYFPLITFVIFKALYDHRQGIFIFVGLLVTFTHGNSVLKREIAKQSRRSFFSLFILFVNLFVCTCFIYFVFRDQKLYMSLILIPPYYQPLSLWNLLWVVGITDFILKFITIQIKAGITCFPARILPYSSRGKWYLMLECSSQLYRGLAPIQPWLYYLMEAYQGPEKAVGVFFSVAYMVSKGTELLSKIKVFLKAFWKLLQNSSLGVRPSKEQLDTAGSLCPICHDEFNAPEVLHCRHVFCESCIATWFDREQTCPLCRAKITDDPSWRDGATTFFVQLF